MRKFFASVFAGITLRALTGLFAFWFWPWHVNADVEPSTVETRMMRHMFDQAVARQAPRTRSVSIR
jgi:hypothetical protein